MPADKIFAVLDTNILVSAKLKPQSPPGEIVSLVIAGKIVPVTCEEIFHEYTRVLARSKFKFAPAEVESILSDIRLKALTVYASDMTAPHENMPDETDTIFYAAALAARAAGNATWLVTGNLRHFPKEHFIISPRAMLDILEQGGA